jgi:tRNA threonylcarbamoyladenosine biosynthesis protein TsaB
MGLILCIETATEICSVALSRDEKILGIRESAARNVHSAMLTVFIGEIMKESGTSFNQLDAIAVSMGPGSYTGLRIGVATAKGLCYATGKPLIAIPTLQAMACGMSDKLQMTSDKSTTEIRNPKSEIRNPKSEVRNPETVNSIPLPASHVPYLFCPMIDARRMEVYCALYDQNFTEVIATKAEIVTESTFSELLDESCIIFAGDGADKCKPFLEQNENAIFPEGFQASAKYMAGLAETKLQQNRFENLVYFEPFYLKDFVAGKSHVKGLQ